MKLTAKIIEATRAPAVGQLFLRDSEVKGFGLRLTAGSKSFVWEGRIKGRPRRITIGGYPDLSVIAARARAQAIRTAIALGQNPAEERLAERREITFGALCEDYLVRHAKVHKRTWDEDEQMIQRYLAEWKTRRISDISINDAAKLHQRIGQFNGHYAANRTLGLVRVIYNLARQWRVFEGVNPTDGIKKFKEEKRERFLSAEELRRVSAALAEEANPYWRAYFPLSLLLGTRKSELLSAKWADIDLANKTWRLPMTKAGRSHLLPLPAPAIEILKNLPSYEYSDWVFVSAREGHPMSPDLVWKRIREKAGVPDVRIHDLRRTLGSWLAQQGYSLNLIGRALNHSNVSTTQVYARLDLDSVRAALEKNASLMLAPLS